MPVAYSSFRMSTAWSRSLALGPANRTAASTAGELAQVGHRRVQHCQVAVVGWQAFLAAAHAVRIRSCRCPREPCPDLFLGDARIQGDGQDLIQQHLAVLAGAGAVGQCLLQGASLAAVRPEMA